MIGRKLGRGLVSIAERAAGLRRGTGGKGPPGFSEHLAALRKDPGGFEIRVEPMNDSGDHPRSHVDFECEFAAAQLSRRRPGKILDIGSYRVFVLGLVANCPVTSLDVRARIPIVAGETVVTGDAKRIELPDRSVDCVLSLCAVEHFGLGRYGDAFDPAADRKAIAEIRRLLRPGGLLLLSTTVTRGRPTLSFNAHRIYTLELIHEMTAGMTPADEAFFSTSRCTPCRHSEVTTDPGKWDVYCGCLVKDPQ